MRFEIQPFANARADKAGALKLLEEAAEVFGAWQAFDNALLQASGYGWGPNAYRNENQDFIAECADLIQAMANLLAAYDFSQEEIDAALEQCRRRNEARGRKYK